MTTVPQHRELEWPRLEPSPEDFAECMKKGGRATLLNEEKRHGKTFGVPAKLTLPKSLKYTIANLKKIDRSAGTSANHRAAAASAWVLANAPSGFVNGPMLWTGELLIIIIAVVDLI